MDRHPDVESTLKWINNQQTNLDNASAQLGSNKASVDQAQAEHDKRVEALAAYRPTVERIKDNTQVDGQQIDEVKQAFNDLTKSSSAQSECLKTMAQITSLENVFALLTKQASEQATAVARDVASRQSSQTSVDSSPDKDAQLAQNNMLSIRESWAWLNKLMKCTETHVQNAAEYQQFFYDVQELSKWMSAEMKQSEKLLNPPLSGVTDIGGHTAKMLSDMRTALSMADHWRGKVDAVVERARKVVPVHLRTSNQLPPNRPVSSLADYKTAEFSIKEGEELRLVSNQTPDLWQVKSRRGVKSTVPSTIILIPGPDPAAERAANKLRSQLQSGWNNVIRNAGKKLINYVSKVIPPKWTPKQEKTLRSLPPAEKDNVRKLLDSIEKTFSPFWDPYRPYKNLRGRMGNLRNLLDSNPSEDDDDLSATAAGHRTGNKPNGLKPDGTGQTRRPWNDAGRNGSEDRLGYRDHPPVNGSDGNGSADDAEDDDATPDLLKLTEPFDEVLEDYSDYWEEWTPSPFKFKPDDDAADDDDDESSSSSTSHRKPRRRPAGSDHNPLSSSSPASAGFTAPDIAKYSQGRHFLPVFDPESSQLKYANNDDWVKQVQDTLDFDDECGYEEWGDYEERMETIQQPVEEEVFTIETAKETAEAQQLITSEQEERQTFVITSVIDPRNGDEISLDRAVSLGIINQRDGKYVNPWTREAIPIPAAMNAGKIKVEFTTTKKLAEKHSDIGLITIKMIKESRPFTVKGAIDVKSDRKLTADEAIKAGILDLKRNVFVNSASGEEMSLMDALDSGLLVVEFDRPDYRHNHEPETVSKTYAVHAVSDVKAMKRLTFSEAIANGLIDPATGAYRNNATGESMYVGDAIKKNFIRATVVHDPKALDIAPGNTFNIDNTAKRFQQHVHAVSAVNALAKGTSLTNGSSLYRK